METELNNSAVYLILTVGRLYLQLDFKFTRRGTLFRICSNISR